ncbi:MAG: radical SAM protein [Bacteroidetes bacterium]|nr:radical SAM protein [bacterium]NBP63896.1 radical SAM protein [Bacteroidota bacterium]
MSLDIHELHIELSSHCNAACPGCTRNISGGKTKNNLVLAQVSLEQFTNWFPEEISSKVNTWVLCGTSGDPATCKDLIEIVDYIRETSPNSTIHVNTNGGVRNADFWYELGKRFSKDKFGQIVFSIDGLEDTNHIYRRNVRWEKLWENFNSAVRSGARIIWDYLVFSHNEHQIDIAKDICDKLGVHLEIKKPLGFENTEKYPVYDKEGNFEYFIRKPSEKYSHTFNYNEGESFSDKIDLKQTEERFEHDKEVFAGNLPETPEFKKRYDTPKEYIDEMDSRLIEPKCFKVNGSRTFYVNSTGDLFPCCWMDAALKNNYERIDQYQIKKWHMEQIKTACINLNQETFLNIINGSYYKNLFQSWQKTTCSDGKLFVCTSACGKHNSIDQIYSS